MSVLQNSIAELMLILLCIRSACSDCNEDGWFGRNCEYKCRCVNNCERSGECPDNVACIQSWFGPACQYRNMLAKSSASQWLLDGNDKTCNPRKDLDTVHIGFYDAVTFTWLRLSFENESDTDSYKITFGQDAMNCTNQINYVVSSHIIDVTCDLSQPFLNMTISGRSVPALCDVYLSLGRNMALRRSTNQTSVFTGTSAVSNLAVDGNSGNNQSCSRTNPESGRSSEWALFYPQPLTFYIIILYPDINNDQLHNFTVTIYDTKNVAIEEFAVSTERTREIPVAFRQRQVKWLKVTGSNETSLTICELETYGDITCPAGKWGLDCTNDCKCPARVSCSPVTGTCGLCPSGFYGDTCTNRCSERCRNRECSGDTGVCKYCTDGHSGQFCESACPAGTYGQNCSKSCNGNCSGSICEPVSGDCTECKAGLYGVDCSIPCPKDCCTCAAADGACTSCTTGFYGENCTTPCPSSCEGSLCDFVSGKCVVAASEDDENVWIPVLIFLGIVLFLCAVLILPLCLVRGTKVKPESY